MNENEMKKPKNQFYKLVIVSVLVSLIFTVVYMCMYPMFYRRAQNSADTFYEDSVRLNYLVQSNYILYRDLYQKESGKNVSYADLYLDTENSDMDIENALETLKASTNATFEDIANSPFAYVERNYEFYIENLKTGASISNSSTLAGRNIDYSFYVSMEYDANGNMTISDIYSKNTDTVFKNLSNLTRNKSLVINNMYDEEISFFSPVNCRIIYGLSQSQLMNFEGSFSYGNLYSSGVIDVHVFLLGLIVLVAFLLPLKKYVNGSFQNNILFKLPIEFFFIEIPMILAITEDVSGFSSLMSGESARNLERTLSILYSGAEVLACISHGLGLFVIFILAWHIGLCLQILREEGIKQYLKKYSFIYRIFPFTKKKVLEMYDAIEHYDVTKNAHKTILKIILVNAVILFIISSLWFGGFMVTIMYSIFLYFFLRSFISKLQKKYSILLSKVNEISEGNLNVEIPDDLGVFEPFKPQLLRIQSGFRNAVEEEVKSQKMKAELITNVSHDLKTPLTAIITYIELLKDENITPEQRAEYLQILDKKSLRLKVLIEDLFEVSKVSSGNVTLNPVDIDVCNLLKQVSLELSDKMEASELNVKMNIPNERIVANLDSQKTYRVFENLLSNVAKYSMPGTRVYVNCYVKSNMVIVEIKNISAVELSVNPEELTERFVRGDASRNTEGSGLGLAIAKNFVELQKGHMDIQIDGDLFKVVTIFPVSTNE